jgi:hypothetical protein
VKAHTNIATVIRNLEQLNAEVRPAVRRATGPKYWQARFARVARQVLKGLAAGEPDEARRRDLLAHVDVVVDSLVATMGPTRWVYQLRLVPAGGLDFGLQYRLPGSEVSTDPLTVSADGYGALQQLVYDWVATEKDWDPQVDGERTLEAVEAKARWITNLVTNRGVMTSEEQAARDAFLRPAERGNGLLEKLTGQTAEASGPVDAVTARGWAQAVLGTWRELVEADLPGALRRELGQLKKFLK